MSDVTIQIDQPVILDGHRFSDERGDVEFVNDVSLTAVKRFYAISNKSTDVIRAWQAHKLEQKYFYVIEGSFLIATVKLDNFDSPSPHLDADHVVLKAEFPQILIVPSGYANGLRALTDANKVMIFSTLNLQESKNDTYRFAPELWFNWNLR
jgi:dTDP-4-dehydrorhamnose 3,5-epimerase